MSDWKVVDPEETENFVQNPSAGAAGNFAAAGGGAITRVTTASKYGLYSYRVVTAANDQGATLTLQALTNNIHHVTMRVAGTLPTAWYWSLDNANYTAPVLLETIDDTWSLYGLQFPAVQANASVLLYVRQDGAGAGDFNIDGIDCEQKEYWTTHTDGTQTGCEWEGAIDGSTSRRSALTRGGGRVLDLQDDYYFQVSDAIGGGMSPQIDNLDSYAIIPGAALNSIKVTARPLTLIGTLTGTTKGNLRDRMQDLINLISSDRFPEDENGIQPVRIRYTGATVQKEIEVHYEAGLEGRQTWRDPGCWERIAGLRFLAPNPDWLEIGETSVLLPSAEIANGGAGNHREFVGRLREASVGFIGVSTPWSNLNVSASPAAGEVLCSVVGPDKRIYIGGSFTDWDGVAGSDYVAVRDPVTDTWATLGGAADFNATVYALAFGPDGTLYAVGNFTNVAGDANADYFAQWDGANWTSVAGGGTVGGRALAVGLDGTIYIGGTFVNWNAIPAADYVVSWDGAAYAALDTGLPSACYALAVHPDGNIYAGGGVGVTSGYIQYWDLGTSAFVDITSNSLSEDVTRGIAITVAGTIYAVGDWPDATVAPPTPQSTPYHIGVYTGSDWVDVGGGVYDSPNPGLENSGDVRSIAIGPDGVIWAAGDFRYIGAAKRDIECGIAAFYGNDWTRPGHRIVPGDIYDALSIGARDPVVEQSYDIYVGVNNAGITIVSTNTDVENVGSALAYPRIILTNESATDMQCYRIENETSGEILLFDYAIVTNEVLTADLRQANKTFISSFFRSVPRALQPDSNVGTWALLSDRTNVINVFMFGGAVADTIIYLIYRTPYRSYD